MKTIALLMVFGVLPSVGVMAQVSNDPTQFSGLLTGSTISVLAFAVIAFVRGWVVSGRQADRLEEENQKLRAELSSRNKEDREHLIPSIVASITEALRQTKSEGGN